jgi:hypothetical protein
MASTAARAVNFKMIPPTSKLQPVWLVAIFATAAAAGLHLYFVSHAGGFWRDEVNLINLSASHSPREMEMDSFPLLVPLFIHVWLATGLDETSLRALGLIIGLGILATLWFASWKINRTPPLLGLALFGMNTALIVFGDSMRAYGLGSLLIVLATFCGGFFLLKPSWKRAAWFAAAAVLSVQTLYHNAMLVGAICLGAILVCGRRKNWQAAVKVLAAGALAAVSLLPYVPNLISVRAASVTLRTGLSRSRLMEGFGDCFGFPLGQYAYFWLLLAAILFFYGWLEFRTNQKMPAESGDNLSKGDLSFFAAATLFFAFGGFLIFLWLAALPSQSWYLLPLMAVAVTCLDFSWPRWRGPMRVAVFGFAAATAVIAIPAASRNLDYRYTNVDVWAQQMKTEVAPEDYVIVVPWFCGITFEHYFKNPAAWDTLPPVSDHATHRFDLVKIQLQNTNAIAPLVEKITTALQSGHRVWILALKGWMDVPDPGTAAAAPLPPAPYGQWGWSEVPYTMVWVSEVAHYVGDHSTQFARVKNPDAGRRSIEDTELFLAAGWKNSAPPAAANPMANKP